MIRNFKNLGQSKGRPSQPAFFLALCQSYCHLAVLPFYDKDAFNFMTEKTNSAQTPTELLQTTLTSQVEALGYELVHMEVITGRQKLLRLFIDHLTPSTGIGIEDCVKVTKSLEEPMEALPEIDKVFSGGAYELEVSSPGIERPLRKEKDFERFAGREARIHVYRPLTAEELKNEEYQRKNPKQKNFVGILKGIRGEKVLLVLPTESKTKKGAKPGSHLKLKFPFCLFQKRT
jgi:ribosome maturation factor RimP